MKSDVYLKQGCNSTWNNGAVNPYGPAVLLILNELIHIIEQLGHNQVCACVNLQSSYINARS